MRFQNLATFSEISLRELTQHLKRLLTVGRFYTKVAIMVVSISMLFAPEETHARTDKVRSALVRMEIFLEALVAFRNDTGRFPSTSEGLAALIHKPADVKNWNGPYLNYPFIPLDLQGKEYIYFYPAKSSDKEFDLYSSGINRTDEHGHGDDIVLQRTLRKVETTEGTTIYLYDKN